MAARGVRYFVAATAVVALAAYVGIYTRSLVDPPIRSDGYSYYVYLPATFLYGDPSLESLSRDWFDGFYPDFTGIRRWPGSGRWVNPHPIGTAVLMLPFFAAAHALSWWSNFPRDGFSFYYQYGAGLAGLTYLLAGLALVRRMLSRHFSDAVVLSTLVCLTWGTNLFHYGVFDATFSHAFSFFLIAAWIAIVDRWWQDASIGLSIFAGIVAALIVITRHTNVLFLLILPLYGLSRAADQLRPKRDTTALRWRALVIMAAVAGVCVLPQLALYRYATGRWLASPYSAIGMTFTFGSPHLVGVLLGLPKGLFFWSPVLLLAVGGLFVADAWARRFAVAAAVIFVADAYLIASWGDWQFGGSFGHRGFTDGLALAAPFLASSFEWASARPRVRIVVAAFAALAVALSIAQMIQYWIGILPISDITWPEYRALFLRF
jgi:hypothetical protein